MPYWLNLRLLDFIDLQFCAVNCSCKFSVEQLATYSSIYFTITAAALSGASCNSVIFVVLCRPQKNDLQKGLPRVTILKFSQYALIYIMTQAVARGTQQWPPDRQFRALISFLLDKLSQSVRRCNHYSCSLYLGSLSSTFPIGTSSLLNV